MRVIPFTLTECLAAGLCLVVVALLWSALRYDHPGGPHVDMLSARFARLEEAVEFFRMDCSRLPTQSEGLDVLLSDDAQSGRPVCAREEGYGIKRSELSDPWGTPIVYSLNRQENAEQFTLTSYGADAVSGGGGINQDVTNRDLRR